MKLRKLKKAVEIVSVRTKCLGFKDMWKLSYVRYGQDYRFFDGQSVGCKLKGIEALPENPTKESIDKLTGNTTWTDLASCEVCEETKVVARVLKSGVEICKSCAFKIALLVEEEENRK